MGKKGRSNQQNTLDGVLPQEFWNDSEREITEIGEDGTASKDLCVQIQIEGD